MELNNKTIISPPWLAYRELERNSDAWHTGEAAAYMHKFNDWLGTLSKEELAEYRSLFPEPVTWRSWWDDDDGCEMLTHGDFSIITWQKKGVPKYSVQWAQMEYAAGRGQELCMFWGHRPARDGRITKSCLSQWWKDSFCSGGHRYVCMEQYMMARKAELFGDREMQGQILGSNDQKQIKALGRRVRGFDQDVWNIFKYSIVLNGNWCKFSQNRSLGEFLLSTGDSVLVEASPYDNIWGIALQANSPEAKDPLKWRGQNLLGFALMEVRDELRRVT